MRSGSPEVAGREPFVHLAMLLSTTERLIGVTGIGSIWARDAVTTSGAARTLTEACGDRVLVGLGVSHQALVSNLRGHDYGQPLTVMLQYLDGVDAAPFSAVDPPVEPRSVPAAIRARMLGLAAERTVGAHTYFVTPTRTALSREAVGDAALLCPEQVVCGSPLPRGPGRSPAGTPRPIWRCRTTCALAELGFDRPEMDGGGADALMARCDEEAVRACVAEHLDAGADHVAVQVLPA